VQFSTQKLTVTGDYTLMPARVLPLKASFEQKVHMEGSVRDPSGKSFKITMTSEESTSLKALQTTPPKAEK
jgi:hypothetical protein